MAKTEQSEQSGPGNQAFHCDQDDHRYIRRRVFRAPSAGLSREWPGALVLGAPFLWLDSPDFPWAVEDCAADVAHQCLLRTVRESRDRSSILTSAAVRIVL